MLRATEEEDTLLFGCVVPAPTSCSGEESTLAEDPCELKLPVSLPSSHKSYFRVERAHLAS